MKEIKKELKKALETGKVQIGSKEVLKSLLTNQPKLVLISKTCPLRYAERIKYYSSLSNVPYLVLEEGSLDLGKLVEKPFNISVIGIIKEGESRILDIVKKP